MIIEVFAAYFVKSILLHTLPEFIVGQIQNLSDSKKLEQEGRKRLVNSFTLILF